MTEKEKLIRTIKIMCGIRAKMEKEKDLKVPKELYKEIIKVMPHWGFKEEEIKQIKCI